MITWLFAIVLASGVGTLLIRLLPMLWQEKGIKEAWRQGARRRALDAIGPSAMIALLVVSFWDMLQPSPEVQSLAPIVAGVLGVLLGRKLLHSIAGATLAGVAAYALVLWWVA
jgi:branched-subunit amino acid transport protein AzlD